MKQRGRIGWLSIYLLCVTSGWKTLFLFGSWEAPFLESLLDPGKGAGEFLKDCRR